MKCRHLKRKVVECHVFSGRTWVETALMDGDERVEGEETMAWHLQHLKRQVRRCGVVVDVR